MVYILFICDIVHTDKLRTCSVLAINLRYVLFQSYDAHCWTSLLTGKVAMHTTVQKMATPFSLEKWHGHLHEDNCISILYISSNAMLLLHHTTTRRR